MQYERYPNELAHYGVKGMKWGVRKRRPLIGNGRRVSISSNVKRYQKMYDDWTDRQDANDEYSRKVKQAYKETGKNIVSRLINNIKGTSAEVKRYNKMYDDWTNRQDKLDVEAKSINESYKKTGKTKVSRVYNNTKYK